MIFFQFSVKLVEWNQQKRKASQLAVTSYKQIEGSEYLVDQMFVLLTQKASIHHDHSLGTGSLLQSLLYHYYFSPN